MDPIIETRDLNGLLWMLNSGWLQRRVKFVKLLWMTQGPIISPLKLWSSTGSEVDAIPVFDEFGINTEVIFNDPRLKNTEFDIIDRPHGAGQGFRERPWSWDSSVGESTPHQKVLKWKQAHTNPNFHMQIR